MIISQLAGNPFNKMFYKLFFPFLLQVEPNASPVHCRGKGGDGRDGILMSSTANDIDQSAG